MGTRVDPFVVPVDAAALGELKRRLAATRWPDTLGGWDHGTDLDVVQELTAEWLDQFDWAEQAAHLDAVLPSSSTNVAGLDVHFAFLPGRGPAPFPLLLMHGWPSSYAEMVELAPGSPIRLPTAAIRRTRSTSSYRRCRVTASRNAPPPGASAPTPAHRSCGR